MHTIESTTQHRRRAWPRPALLALAGALLLPAAGCSIDDLLSVGDPDVATPGSLTGAAALPALLAGARSDFQVAFSGASNSEGQVTYTGLFTDELLFVESFDTRLQIDKRDVRADNSNVEAVFRNVMRARASAETAAERFEEFDANSEGHALSLSLAGYSYIMVGENWCSGVPFSRLVDGVAQYGEPETTAQIFGRAVASFEDAVAAATAAGDDDLLNLARVGLGRAHLNLDQHAEAAAAVQDVPVDFEFEIEHSENTPRQYNGIFSFTFSGRRFSVSDQEAGEGLPFRSADDPRLPWDLATVKAWDGSSDLYLPEKYPSRSAGVALATGIEAQLILAEVALNGAGGATAMYTILNDLRSDFGVTPALTPGATFDDAVDDLFYERAFWMYLTAHRLGDLRRLVRDYGRAAESVYPSGQYWKLGQSYGPDLSFPVSTDEQGNPNFQACDETQP